MQLDLDLIQIVSFSLEMIGFSLVFIETFRRHLVGRANKSVFSFRTYVHSFLAVNLGNADDDQNVPLEVRNEEFRNGKLVQLQQVILWWLIFHWWGPVDGFLAGVGKCFGVLMLGFFGAILTHYLLILVLNSAVKAAELAGKGSPIAGVGFVIAGAGLLLETVQVAFTRFQLVALGLWVLTLAIVAVAILRRRRKATPDGAQADDL